MNYKYKDLVERSKQGDKEATSILIKRLNPLIYSAIGRYGKNLDREDIYQQACLIIMESIKEFDSELNIPFLAYIKSRIYFGVLNMAKKHKEAVYLYQPLPGQEDTVILDLLEDDSEELAETMIKKEQYEKIAMCINSLPPKQREVITLHYFKGQRLKDIASMRGVHYKTILGLKNRAIKRLEKSLKNISIDDN